MTNNRNLKLNYTSMKKITGIFFAVIILIISVTNLRAQAWTRTNGPGGGHALTMIEVEGGVIVQNHADGYIDGSIYKTTDDGQIWTPAGFGAPLYLNGFVKIGTTIFTSSRSYGVFKSTDNGETFQPTANPFPSPFVKSLGVNGSSLFAGGDGDGIYRSTNMGDSWTHLLNGFPFPSVQIVNALESLNGIIFAGIRARGVYRSTNNGDFWELVNNGLPASGNFSPLSFAVSGNVILVCTRGSVGNFPFGNYRSTDFGNTWTEANSGIPPFVGGSTQGIFSIDNDLYTYVFFNSIYKSTNQGQSWFPSGTGLPNKGVFSVVKSGIYIYAGLQSSSVYRSSDNGNTWHESNIGLANNDVRSLFANGNDLYAGTFITGLHRSPDNGVTWSSLNTGLPFNEIGDIIFTGTNLLVGMKGFGIYRSNNNGSSWTSSNNGITGSSTYSTYITSLLKKGNDIFTAGWSGLFMSTDNGLTWQLKTNGLPFSSGSNLATIHDLALSGNSIIAAMGDYKGIFRSSNNGEIWLESFTGIPTTARIVYSLTVSDGKIFAATERGVYRSTNEGASWTALTNGITQGIMEAITSSGSKIFVSSTNYTLFTGFGVYMSTDYGDSWTTANEGLVTNLSVRSLIIKDNFVYAGSDTRSVFKRSLGGSTLDLTALFEGFYNVSTDKMIQDTAVVYLRSSLSPYLLIDSAKSFIDSIGHGSFIFNNATSGVGYFLVVKHRNSIETWSSTPSAFISNELTYNFTTSSSQAFGNNLVNKGSRYCIYSGDVNQDGIVDGNDASDIDNDAYNFITGYVSTDLTGDNIIDASDASIVDNNTKNFVGKITP